MTFEEFFKKNLGLRTYSKYIRISFRECIRIGKLWEKKLISEGKLKISENKNNPKIDIEWFKASLALCFLHNCTLHISQFVNYVSFCLTKMKEDKMVRVEQILPWNHLDKETVEQLIQFMIEKINKI